MFEFECDKCGEQKKMMARYDAFWCEECDEWKEPTCKCAPGTCEFLGRPEKPSMVPEKDRGDW